MALTQSQRFRIAKALVMHPKDLDQFIRRLTRHLKRVAKEQEICDFQVLLGMNILVDIQEQAKQQHIEIDFTGFTQRELRHHGKKIMTLHIKEGLGAQAICNYLKVHHNANISKSTIRRFISHNKERYHG